MAEMDSRTIRSNRGVAAVVFLTSAGVLGLALWLSPSPDGLGTHRQIGLPACGFYAGVGMPCATCGMTTSFSHAAHGQIVEAFVVQPAGALLALLTAVTVIVSGWATASGMSLTPLAQWIWRPRAIVGFGAIVLVAWLYKIGVVQGWWA